MVYKQLKFMDGEILLISPEEAEAVERAMRSKAVHARVQGKLITLSTISRIEDSEERMPRPANALPGTVAKDHQHRPVALPVTEDGYRGVRAIMVKQKVSRKYYEKWLAERSTQHVLEDEGAYLWIASKHVPCADCGITRADAIECDADEYAKINAKKHGQG